MFPRGIEPVPEQMQMPLGGRIVIALVAFGLAALVAFLGASMMVDGNTGEVVLGALVMLIAGAIAAMGCLPLRSKLASPGVPGPLMLLMLAPLLFALVTLPLFVAGVLDWPEWVRGRGPIY